MYEVNKFKFYIDRGLNNMSKNTKKTNLQTSNKNSAKPAAKSMKPMPTKLSKPVVNKAKPLPKAKPVISQTKPVVKVKPVAKAKPIVKAEPMAKTVNNTTKNNPSKNTSNTSKQKVERGQTNNQMNNNYWLNMFDSSMTDDFKEGMERFMETANISLCGSNAIGSNASSITKDLVTQFSDNLRQSFEQNMEFSQSILKCKTAADFIEFQRKGFEMNYKNISRLYSDFFHGVQSLMNQSLKDGSKYVSDSKGIIS